MINPFDRSFFKFTSGFLLILFLSIAILFFVRNYSGIAEKGVVANTELEK